MSSETGLGSSGGSSTGTACTQTPSEVTNWRNGVVVAYAASGLAFSTWVSRLPAIREELELTPGTIGLLLLCLTAGSFVSVSASGLIVLRLGSKRTIRTGSIVVGCGLVLAGAGASLLSSPLAVAAGLATVGLGTASWNTASNVEGAAVERALGRTIMPRLHGTFSLGTVAGAGLGALQPAPAFPFPGTSAQSGCWSRSRLEWRPPRSGPTPPRCRARPGPGR